MKWTFEQAQMSQTHLHTHAFICARACACTCTCMCTRTHRHIHTHTHLHTRTHAHTHMHTRTHTFAHTHTYTFAHTHTHTHICTHTHTHARTHAYTHTHTHTFAHTHTHTYTCACKQNRSVFPYIKREGTTKDHHLHHLMSTPSSYTCVHMQKQVPVCYIIFFFYNYWVWINSILGHISAVQKSAHFYVKDVRRSWTKILFPQDLIKQV